MFQVVEAQEQIARDLRELRDWSRSFYERHRDAELKKEVCQRAPTIFAGGRGGNIEESAFVRKLLRPWLRTLNGDDPILEAAADPTPRISSGARAQK